MVRGLGPVIENNLSGNFCNCSRVNCSCSQPRRLPVARLLCSRSFGHVTNRQRVEIMLARAVRSCTFSCLFGAVLFVSVVPLGSQA